jgi:hypothetical protein
MHYWRILQHRIASLHHAPFQWCHVWHISIKDGLEVGRGCPEGVGGEEVVREVVVFVCPAVFSSDWHETHHPSLTADRLVDMESPIVLLQQPSDGVRRFVAYSWEQQDIAADGSRRGKALGEKRDREIGQ